MKTWFIVTLPTKDQIVRKPPDMYFLTNLELDVWRVIRDRHVNI